MTRIISPISFHPGHAITAAGLAQGLFAFINSEVGQLCKEENIQTVSDRWLGGALNLACLMAPIIDRHISYENGVFTYEYCETTEDEAKGGWDTNKSLPAFLLRQLTPAQWYEVSENWEFPSEETLRELLFKWVDEVGDPNLKRAEEVQP